MNPLYVPGVDNIPNPLDSFNNYSIHYLLTVSGNTLAYNQMIDNGVPDTSLGNPVSPLLQQVLKAQNPGDAFLTASSIGGSTTIDNNSPNSCYLLLDSRRFSQYAISNFEMDHAWGTGDDPNNPTVPVSLHTMQIVDSYGLGFFNMLMNIFRNKLLTNATSAFFLLTIFFVGWDDSGQEQVVSTCYVPLMMSSISMGVDSSGGKYELVFAEMGAGWAKGSVLSQFDSLVNVQSITTQYQPNTIGGFIAALEQELNIQMINAFLNYKNNAIGAAQQQNKNFSVNQNIDIIKAAGKLVQYMITIPKEWESFPVSTAALSQYKEQLFKSKTQDDVQTQQQVKDTNLNIVPNPNPIDAYAQLSFSPNMDIPAAIKLILECSTDYLNLATPVALRDGKAISNKIVREVTSDENSYIIHYDIYKFHLPKLPTDQQQKKDQQVTNAQSTLTAGGITDVKVGDSSDIKNLMVFNYIFTGKNNNIFDFKINYSPSSIAILTSNIHIGKNRFKLNGEKGQRTALVEAEAGGTGKTVDFTFDRLQQDPILPPMKSIDQKDNNASQHTEDKTTDQATADFIAKQNYTQTLAYMHFMSSMDADIGVRGNPSIIRKIADKSIRGGYPPHTPTVNGSGIDSLIQFSARKNENFTTLASQLYSSMIQPTAANAKAIYQSTYVQKRIDTLKGGAADWTNPATSGPDMAVYPLFCKVNIKSPNVDAAGNVNSASMFTDEYFFNGVYYVLNIHTSFGENSNQFTHTLKLIPFMAADTMAVSDQGPASTTAPAPPAPKQTITATDINSSLVA